MSPLWNGTGKDGRTDTSHDDRRGSDQDQDQGSYYQVDDDMGPVNDAYDLAGPKEGQLEEDSRLVSRVSFPDNKTKKNSKKVTANPDQINYSYETTSSLPTTSPRLITQPLQRLITDPSVDKIGVGGSHGGSGPCEFILTVISVLVIIASLPFSLFFCIKVVQEYERAVIFRLGCLLKGGARGPGIFFIIPCIDTYCKVDLRTVTFDVPPQEILSKDSVTVSVDAVVYYRISNATIAVTNVEDYNRSTRLLAATTLRNVLGTKNLTEILSERESISRIMRVSLDDATDPWGVHVERVEVKDVRLPVQMQRAMAAEAEAARDARAKVIMAQGELKSCKFLKDAADTLSGNTAAMQLRYLQSLNSIAAENNSTIIFPVPMTLFDTFNQIARSLLVKPNPIPQTPINEEPFKIGHPRQEEV